MKPVRFQLLILSLILLPFFLYSQGPGKADVIYLKNGSKLIGKIIPQQDPQKTGIEIIGANILVFNNSEIEKVEQNTSLSPGNHIETSTLLNFYGGDIGSAGFHVNATYRFRSGTGVGPGCGVDFFSYQVMPVFAEVSQNILKGRLVPYVYGQAGYSVPLTKYNPQNVYGYTYNNTKLKGGILLAAGGGLRAEINPRFSLLFSVGYRYQRLRQVTDLGQSYYNGESPILERIDHINRINVAIGILFK